MRSKLGGWEMGLTPETINNFRQNTPELVIRDAKRMLNLNDNQCETLKQILLARGINKWLKARRDIIALKNDIKIEIKKIQENYDRKKDKTKLKLLEDFRAKLRRICHQERWVEWSADANPRKAKLKVLGPRA